MGKLQSYLHVLSGVDYFDKTFVGDTRPPLKNWDHLIGLCFSHTTKAGFLKNTFCVERVSDPDFRRVWSVIGGMGFTDAPKKTEVLYKVEELRRRIPTSLQFWIAWWHDNHIIPHKYNSIDSIIPHTTKRFQELWDDSKRFPEAYWESKRQHLERKKTKKEAACLTETW